VQGTGTLLGAGTDVVLLAMLLRCAARINELSARIDKTLLFAREAARSARQAPQRVAEIQISTRTCCALRIRRHQNG
jgi:hypothetical protein